MTETTIIQAISNKQIFGALFKDLSSWRAWLVWLKSVFGLPKRRAETKWSDEIARKDWDHVVRAAEDELRQRGD